MIKLIALYKRPEDVDAFEEHYNTVHVPLVQQVPHLRALVASRVWGAPRGEPAYYRVAEMIFDDRAAFDAAMASPENRAAGKDLAGFASHLVTLIFTESVDAAPAESGAAAGAA